AIIRRGFLFAVVGLTAPAGGMVVYFSFIMSICKLFKITFTPAYCSVVSLITKVTLVFILRF
ncbi:hypothetical protein, partial [Klebsiella pneumoniae]|uniref:hypothetical protein n=1 Tax=Klebsiella pneumoniae TaxID=573 RepID=UPI001B8A9A92